MKKRRYTIYMVLGAVMLVTAFFGFTFLGSGDNGATEGGNVSVPKILPDTIPESEQKGIDLTQTFSHADLRFSFSYPEDFTASRLKSLEGGETIVVQNAKRNAGFQIHLEPYEDSDTDITAERLARDIPEMVVKEPQDILIGTAGEQGKGLAFIASDSKTREVWFAFRGTLYQITTFIGNDALLKRVLNTWDFE